jgi:transcriptional regulator
MFSHPSDRVRGIDDLLDLAERARFGHLVSYGMHGYQCTGMPFLVDRDGADLDRGNFGRLRCHLAKANAHWKGIDGSSVFVLFPLTDGYVSPAWYPSKQIDGKVVPTWNYEVVHVEGRAIVRDDAEFCLRLVAELSGLHETARSDPGAELWAVTDAPDEFTEKMLRAIVGLEIEITSIRGKRKLSNNRSVDDQLGVVAGLSASARTSDHELADAMRENMRQ